MEQVLHDPAHGPSMEPGRAEANADGGAEPAPGRRHPALLPETVIVTIQSLPHPEGRARSAGDSEAGLSSASLTTLQGEPSAPLFPAGARTSDPPRAASGILGWAVGPSRRPGQAAAAAPPPPPPPTALPQQEGGGGAGGVGRGAAGGRVGGQGGSAQPAPQPAAAPPAQQGGSGDTAQATAGTGRVRVLSL